ncbi:MAG: CBS domain-containing protein [Phycisphaerales bacterium]|nr:MAG: CBS domain-containing protein [Phycisphaerales bacterium]
MSTIRDVLTKKGTHVATISPDASALEAANAMNKHHCGALCVVKDEALVGVFTERDLLNKVVSARLDPASTKVADVMTTSVITCGPNGRNDDCVAVMSHRRVRHLPVLENGKLVGIVSTGDLMALQVEEKQAFIEDLYEYLHGRT